MPKQVRAGPAGKQLITHWGKLSDKAKLAKPGKGRVMFVHVGTFFENIRMSMRSVDDQKWHRHAMVWYGRVG